MDEFSALQKTMDAAIRSGQVSTPVSVDLSFGMMDSTLDSRVSALARLLELASSWLGSSVVHLAVMQSKQEINLSLLAKFQHGQSAVLSVFTCKSSGLRSHAVVFGSRGQLSWEGSHDLFDSDNARSVATHASRKLEETIRESLRISSVAGESRSESTLTLVGSSGHWDGTVWPTKSQKPLPCRPPYGVLLVAGNNTHQPTYAQAFKSDPRCRLVGLTDSANVTSRRRELNEQFAQELGIPVLLDLNEALHRPDVHIVSICAEPERRGPIICQAARAGKHLYLDKPLAGSIENALEIAAETRSAKVVTHMFSQVNWSPAKEARELISAGFVGDLAALHCQLSFAKGHAGSAKLGQRRRESCNPREFEGSDSKRELTNIGVYPLVMLLWLLQRRVRRVYASTGNYFFAEHQNHDMEDFGQMLLEMDGGIVATVTVGRTGWYSHPAGGLNRVTLAGNTNAAVVDAFRPRVETCADVQAWQAPPRDPQDPMAMWAPTKGSPFLAKPKQDWFPAATPSVTADIGHFLDCVERGQPSEVPAELAAAATAVLFAAYESAATDRIIEV